MMAELLIALGAFIIGAAAFIEVRKQARIRIEYDKARREVEALKNEHSRLMCDNYLLQIELGRIRAARAIEAMRGGSAVR